MIVGSGQPVAFVSAFLKEASFFFMMEGIISVFTFFRSGSFSVEP